MRAAVGWPSLFPSAGPFAPPGSGGAGGLLEDMHTQLEASGAVVTTTADEVASDTGLPQRYDCLAIGVGTHWVYGLAGGKLRCVHFQHIVQRRVIENCTRTHIEPRKIITHTQADYLTYLANAAEVKEWT